MSVAIGGLDVRRYAVEGCWTAYPALHPADAVFAVSRAEHERMARADLLVPEQLRVVPGNPAAGLLPRQVLIPSDAAFLALDDVGSGP